MTDRVSDRVSQANHQSSRTLSNFDSKIRSIISGVYDSGVSSALNRYLNDSDDCKNELEHMKRNVCDKMDHIEGIERHYLNELSEYMGYFDSSWMKMMKNFGANVSEVMEGIAKSSWLTQAIMKMNLGQYSELFDDDMNTDWFSHALDDINSEEDLSKLLIEYDQYKQMPLWAQQEMNSYKTSWYLSESAEEKALFHGYANNLRDRLKVYNQMSFDDKMRIDKLYETSEMTMKEQMRIDDIFDKYKGSEKITYKVHSGDTLSKIASEHNVTVDQLIQWNNIENKNLIHVGQLLTIGGIKKVVTDKKEPQKKVVQSKLEASETGFIPTNAAREVYPELVNHAGNRSVDVYNQVIDQFNVETHGRYRKRDGNTYCNIFAWDVTRAMGAEIPHWLTYDNEMYHMDNNISYKANTAFARELNANSVYRYMENHCADIGYQEVTPLEGQSLANEGKPVVVVWENKGGIGHVAVVRPDMTGQVDQASEIRIAQAGGKNFSNGTLEKGFNNVNINEMKFYAHD